MKKIFWQCPKCGGILEKKAATLAASDQLKGILGDATCSYCMTGQPAADVYGGKYDFAESDDFIRQMAADQVNVSFDEARMRYSYKGKVVELASSLAAPGKSGCILLIVVSALLSAGVFAAALLF
jgi:hypothetical protein